VSDLRKRLQSLCDGLPAEGTVTFTKSALAELLALEPDLEQATLPTRDLTMKEVGERYGRSASTIRDWVRERKLEAYVFNGREKRVTPEALAKFERDQRRDGLGDWRKIRNAKEVEEGLPV
jgi:excisionase family DNA binding protein